MGTGTGTGTGGDATVVNGVFEGGGAKGLVYVGALRACEERELRFGAVAGSSAGAITAMLVACGYTADEVVDYFATQYGSQVLQEPPKTGFTLTLWALPFIMILLGAFLLFFTMRKWSSQKNGAAVATLTPATTTPDGVSNASDDYLSQVDKDLGLE